MKIGLALKSLSEGVRESKQYEGGFFEPLIDRAYGGMSFMVVSNLSQMEKNTFRNNSIKVKEIIIDGIKFNILQWGNATDNDIRKYIRDTYLNRGQRR